MRYILLILGLFFYSLVRGQGNTVILAVGSGSGGIGQSNIAGLVDSIAALRNSINSSGVNATTATALLNARDIYGNSFNGTASLTQVIAPTYGGTNNAFFGVTGPASSIKTYTFPNASATILTDNALVTGAQGGTSNGFFAVSGPATSLKTFTFPNASATVLTTNSAVSVSQGGTGAATLTGILVGDGTNAVTAVAGTANQYLRRNAGNTAYEFGAPPGGGDALVANPLSQFAATTSAQLLGVISNEEGSGLLVFNNSPTLITPVLGVATATSINKVTITAPATSATLTIVNGGSLITAGAFATTLTSTGTTNVTLPTTGTLASLTGTETFTNKRWTARVGSTTSSATPTINTDNTDVYKLTAQAAAISSFSSNLSGAPNDGDVLEIQITDNGTARAITWGASFVSSSVALPSTTTISTTLTVILQYYTFSSYGNGKWVCVNFF